MPIGPDQAATRHQMQAYAATFERHCRYGLTAYIERLRASLARDDGGSVSDPAMGETVCIERLRPRLLAAVRRTAKPGQIPHVFKPALDLVWAFLRQHPGLHGDGHNVFLYHHVDRPGAGMPIDFGVE